ncbi:hypothetical protein DS893_00315 [Vibrionales bacterium C3R12]|nr:hypothetical protein DS893_00315 [Vibrionales bacterium C3R12]
MNRFIAIIFFISISTPIYAASLDELDPAIVNAAQQGDAAAQYYVGQELIGHFLVDEEMTEVSLEWLNKAHKQGHAEATAKIAIIYKSHGKKSVINPVKALKYLHIAADRGADRAPARLAEMYYLGKGTIQDNVEAYAWISVAIAISTNDKMTKRMRKGKEQIENAMNESELNQAKSLAREHFTKFQEENQKWRSSKLFKQTAAYY